MLKIYASFPLTLNVFYKLPLFQLARMLFTAMLLMAFPNKLSIINAWRLVWLEFEGRGLICRELYTAHLASRGGGEVLRKILFFSSGYVMLPVKRQRNG